MKTVAVIGASTDRRKFGNKALRAFREAGYRAIPITPHHPEVEGERAYATVLDYPGAIDMATVYVPPEIGEHAARTARAERALARCGSIPAPDAPALLAKARALGIRPIQAAASSGSA